MNVHIFLIQLVVILLAARIFCEIAAFCHVPAVIGEMVAGIVIGPSVLGWIQLSDPIQLMAQIGIILLLFEVGTETDLSRLTSSGKKVLNVALCGAILPFILGFGLSYYVFSLSMLIAFFIASMLTATSIGITMRVLKDLKRHDSPEAQVIIGAAVIDDMISIVLLSLLYEFATSGAINWLNTAKLMLFIVLFFIASPVAAKLLAKVIQKWDQKTAIPGLLPTTLVSLILLFAWLAYTLGAPELLGGFAVGLALSRQFFFPFAKFLHQSSEFSEHVEKQMPPIIHLFTPIFFVTVGISLNLHKVDWSSQFIWELSGLLILVAILGKLVSAMFVKGISWMEKMIIGTSMIPRGEVGLIFANVGLTAGIFKDNIYAALILVISITTVITPIILRWIYLKKHMPSVKL